MVYERTTRLRVEDLVDRCQAAIRPVLGSHEGGRTARWRGHRLATAGPISRPMCEIAVETASDVVRRASSGDPFVLDRDGERMVIGVHLDARNAVLDALVPLAQQPGWFIEWHDRGAAGVVALGDATGSRRVRLARAWVVFRSFSVGPRATGPELGVVVTFWVRGSSGQLERIGHRGQERFDERSESITEWISGRPFPGRTAFPVSESFDRFEGPVDIVYTWVDGTDPEWVRSFRSTATSEGRLLDEESLDPARYHSRDELRYSLRSVWMYCGWVRNIYVVTAGQRPSWLRDGGGVTIIDHRDILPDSALPTFNSHAIEASLHRIAGLTEHFVYFNDDMLVTAPIRPGAFFHPNGLPYWFPADARVPGVEDRDTQAVDTAALRGRELLRERFGAVVSHKPMHSPYPLLRSVIEEVEREFPEVIAATRHSRFRSPADLSVAASFAQHYGFATGRAVIGELENEYVHVESRRLRWHLDRILLDDELQTCCINETHRPGTGDHEHEAAIQRFFERKFPVAAPWEGSAS